LAVIFAHWTDEQVAALNRWQGSGFVPEFICPNEHPGDSGQVIAVLSATRDGWTCPLCAYKRNWAHDYMFDQPPNPLAPS
jgi:hypothetical protein